MVTSRSRSVKAHPGKRDSLTPVVACILVGAAILGLLFAAPIGSTAAWLPRPVVDTSALDRLGKLDRDLIDELATRPLSMEVRTLGTELRSYHRAQIAGENPSNETLTRHAARALRQGHGRQLLALRALQSELWLRSVFTRPPMVREAEELGGPALAVGREVGWFRRGPVLSRSELGLLYRFRWTELMGLLDHPSFRPFPTEWQAYYDLLLRYPPGRTKEARIEAQLRVVDALARRDNSYPAAFAQATLRARLGQPTEALAAALSWRGAASDKLRLRGAAQLRGILEGTTP